MEGSKLRDSEGINKFITVNFAAINTWGIFHKKITAEPANLFISSVQRVHS